ncbi:MAG: PKD repeat protein, partial [Pirellulaceae bacterium]
AFGISGISISSDDLLADTTAADALSASAYVALTTLNSFVIETSAFFAKASEDMFDELTLGDIVYDDLALRIEQPNSQLALSSGTVVRSIVQGVAGRIGLTEFGIEATSEIGDAAVSMISNVLDGLSALRLVDFATPAEFLAEINKYKVVAQAQLPQQLRDLANGTVTPAAAVAAFSGAALQQRIADASPHIILPPLITISDPVIVEGESGVTHAEFIVSLTREHDEPVSVSFETQDGTATQGDGDYDHVSGILTWLAHDNTDRVVQVPINGDAELEGDEDFKVVLFELDGAAFEKQDGRGLILSDEPIVFDATGLPDSEPIGHLILADDERLFVSSGSQEVFFADKSQGAEVSLVGPDDRVDAFTVDFSANLFRPDEFEFAGGSGVDDSLRILGGTYSLLEAAFLENGNGNVRLDPIDDVDVPIVNWSGIEITEFIVAEAQILSLYLAPNIADELILEDADPREFGRLRLRSANASFAPIEFTNPTNLVRIVAGSPTATLDIGVLDERFTGTVEFLAVDENPPTDLQLSSNSVSENVAAGTTVGSFSTVDPDNADSFTYSLVGGSGDVDNASFAMSGAELRTVEVFDFETKASYSIRVRTTDSFGFSLEEMFTINVSDLTENFPPVVAAGANQVVDEGGTVSLAPATYADPDGGNHTATVNWGDGTPTSNASVDQANDAVSASHVFADDGEFTVTVCVLDDQSVEACDTLTFTVDNLAPVVDAGSNRTVVEGQLIEFAGSFNDPGLTDTHSLLWNFSDGTTDNSTLAPSHTFVSEGVFTVTLTVTDNDGLVGSDTLVVTVNSPVETVPPVVALVSINAELIDPPDLPKGDAPSSWMRQRSSIESLTIDFSEDITATVEDFSLTNLGVDGPAEQDQEFVLEPQHFSVNGARVVLTFAPGELAEGVYRLDIRDEVTDVVGNNLDGDGDGDAGGDFAYAGDSDNKFYILGADWNGDEGVSVFDFTTFSYWFGVSTIIVPRAPRYVDLNHDDGISVFDFTGFSNNFGLGVIYQPAFAPMDLGIGAHVEQWPAQNEGADRVGGLIEQAEPTDRDDIPLNFRQVRRLEDVKLNCSLFEAEIDEEFEEMLIALAEDVTQQWL